MINMSAIHEIAIHPKSLLNDSHFNALINQLEDGFAFCRMHYKNGKPNDFTVLQVNSAFRKLFEIKDDFLMSSRGSIPGLTGSNRRLCNIFGRVATSGKPEKFDSYLSESNRRLRISAFCPEEGYFGVIFSNISHRKPFGKQEKNLAELSGINNI
jgi:hypothetical protein